MSNYIKDVAEFHTTFNHPINDVKDEIDLKLRQLRIKLLFEELAELAEASDVKFTMSKLCDEYLVDSESYTDGSDVDKVEEVDALCDIQYVLSGAILVLGHHERFDEAFAEVQASNMSKQCANTDEVCDTIDMYIERGMERKNIKFEENGDKFIVIRKEDGKILKNKHYKPADLTPFV